MFNSNNQVIIEDPYDESIHLTEDDIIEYAEYIGIDPENEPELMWIAKQGVKAPLPKGWKAVHDPTQNELYYFNFETGESIWDHPCDKDFKNLVSQERKLLREKGRENYKPSLINSLKSTSTLSDILNAKTNQNNLRSNDLGLDTREMINVEYEEENEIKRYDQEEEEESEASWQKKSESDDSDDFQKPVDFGIDKETSIRLDKLNLTLLVNKADSTGLNNQESAPTSSRENVLDSPTRNYIKGALGLNKQEENDLRKSTSILESKKQLDSLIEEKSSELKDFEPTTKDKEKELRHLKESLDREFDQRRLEMLENKENQIEKLKLETETEMERMRKNLQKEQEVKLKELRTKIEAEFNREKEILSKKHSDMLSNMQKEFENEKQFKKQKFSMQLSRYIKSGQSFDELDENEEKREIEVYFEHIEKKYSDKLEERKKEIHVRYEKKLKELDDELHKLYEQESEQKQNEIRLLKEKNLKIDNFDKQMEKLLADKIKEFKDKETFEINRLKEEYEIKIKTFKDKYHQLEENEFNFLESEFNKTKERLQTEFDNKVLSLQKKFKIEEQNLNRQEEVLKKRFDVIEDKKRLFKEEWNRLNEDDKNLNEKKDLLIEKIAAKNSNIQNINLESDDLKMKYELEKLKLEKSDLENKLSHLQSIIDKFFQEAELRKEQESESEEIISKLNKINSKLSNEFEDDDQDEQQIDTLQSLNDDQEIKELVKHAKLKLKLKYLNSKKQAEIDLSTKSSGFSNDSDDSSNDNLNTQIDLKSNSHLTEAKKSLIENLSKEKDNLKIANELLKNYKQNLLKRKLKLDSYRSKNVFDESKKLLLEKEELDLEQLGLNIKTGKRLIKQKKLHLNLLENNIIGNLNSLTSDTSSSQEDLFETDKQSYLSGSNIDSLISFKNNSNLNEFINKLKISHSKGDFNDSNLKNMNSILKKLPKLNQRLEQTFENMKYNSDKKYNLNDSLEKKWKIYFNQEQDEMKMNFFQNLINNHSIKIPEPRRAWENTSAYHKLTFETGSKMLEDKWKQYLGLNSINQNNSKKAQNQSFQSQFVSTSQITLPVSTQNRLNQHREWIKKFKASNSNLTQL